MNNIKLWNSSVHLISNSFVIGCSILTMGMITSTYLNGIISLHLTLKYNQQNNCNDYYCHHFLCTFIVSVYSVSFVTITMHNNNKYKLDLFINRNYFDFVLFSAFTFLLVAKL